MVEGGRGERGAVGGTGADGRSVPRTCVTVTLCAALLVLRPGPRPGGRPCSVGGNVSRSFRRGDRRRRERCRRGRTRRRVRGACHGSPTLTRRTFVRTGAAPIVTLSLPAWSLRGAAATAAGNSLDPELLASWLEVQADGTVVLRTGRAEMGVGIAPATRRWSRRSSMSGPNRSSSRWGIPTRRPTAADSLTGTENLRKVEILYARAPRPRGRTPPSTGVRAVGDRQLSMATENCTLLATENCTLQGRTSRADPYMLLSSSPLATPKTDPKKRRI